MVHLHYSPFQFATANQVSEDHVGVKKILKTNARLTKKDRTKAKLIPTTMPCSEAHEIIGTPNAFISPNSIDGMRMIHSVFGAT
jgi:hypothetical protein